MTENHVENYCSRSVLLLRMLDGDLAQYIAPRVREEIQRVLRLEPVSVGPVVLLAEADE